ncbi:GNAT family N-acetyltransferase [Streptomyces sp. NPDC007088]|uniref:GNAT family N-acetyltransferase n=1 Tax=Streptomyces sp. NPDC007088 TaxID=3364773 RepID=UPI0036AE84BC
MTVEVRRLDKAFHEEWYGNLVLAFGGVEEAWQERALWDALTEYDRALAAWDGDRLIGSAGGFGFRVSVPGGALVPATGVTMVSVATTHRRRGVLTAMMRRQLDDVRALGEPLAVLTASEPAIYGRFGYASASRRLVGRIDTDRVRLSLPAGTEEVRLRRVGLEEGLEPCESVYARRVPGRPGMLARQPGWERLAVLDPERDREGHSPLQCVLAERDGEVVGYTRFSIRPEWDEAGPKGTVRVRDLYGLDPAAYAALLRYLFSVDLTSTLHLPDSPVDAAWQEMVSDVRRCRLRVRDGLYVRLVDVGAALSARAYRTPVDVVLEVEDAFCPWNEGRWLLTGGPAGARCVPTGREADLSLSVRELGAVYLGGSGLTGLGAAGRVVEHRAGALEEASVAFGSSVAPWLPHGF